MNATALVPLLSEVDNTPSIIPENATFKKLFLCATNRVYCVPNYQRYYAWESQQVRQFMDDLKFCYDFELTERIPYQHFLGQIIMRNAQERNEANGIEYFEIIDGQQRLTTFAMLCLVFFRISKELLSRNQSLQTDINVFQADLKKVLFLSETTRPRLLLSEKDKQFWNDIVIKYTEFSQTELVSDAIISHKKMQIAIEMMETEINTYIYACDDYQRLNTIRNLFFTLTERMHIISVTSEPNEYMFALFQTVNDRGRLLTNGELLKAKTLEALRTDSAKQRMAERHWNNILSDDGKTTDQYLEWCYISAVGAQITKEKSLFHQYVEKYFDETMGRHLNDLQMGSLLLKIKELDADIALCRMLEQGKWPFEHDDRPLWKKSRLYEVVRRLRHNKCIPVFLSVASLLRKLPENASIEQKKTIYDLFYQILDIVDRFFFSYIKIADADENNFRNAYARFSFQLRNNGYSIQNFINDLHRIMEEADVVSAISDYLSRQIYSNKRSHTKELHLLYLLEIYFNTGQVLEETLDDATDIYLNNLSVEHIYSKSLPIDEQDNALEPFKNHLGNLTLLGKRQNNELKNSLYGDKIFAYRNSSFRMTRDITENTQWLIESFNCRNAMLISLAKRILSLV